MFAVFFDVRRACRVRREAALSQSGFTLIELVIVLLVSVLGLTVIGSNISSGNQSTRLEAAARDVASALRHARGQALVNHRDMSVAFSLADNAYAMGDDKPHLLPAQLEMTLTIAQDQFENDEIGHIRFFADGSSTGGRVTLVWDNLLRRIDVNWITGAVAISDAAE